MRPAILAAIWLGCISLVAGRIYWRDEVPLRYRLLRNPYAGQVRAAQAGGKLYSRYCAPCHGREANGLRHAPSLRSPEVKGASAGELFWLLRNGNLRHGMPSWSHLPDEQRWQIVTLLQSYNHRDSECDEEHTHRDRAELYRPEQNIEVNLTGKRRSPENRRWGGRRDQRENRVLLILPSRPAFGARITIQSANQWLRLGWSSHVARQDVFRSQVLSIKLMISFIIVPECCSL
jgi:mono/diheme cytochrome c family protein